MSDIQITQDENLDVAALFESAKSSASTPTTETVVTPSEVKTPLQKMREQQNQGVVIQNVNDDGPKLGGQMMKEDTISGVQKTLDEMDDLAEKARQVKLVSKPKSDLEMAQMIDALDNMDIDELKSAKAIANNETGNDTIKETDLIGSDINSGTEVLTSGELQGNKFFVPRTDDGTTVAKEAAEAPTERKPEVTETTVTIEKAENPEGTSIIEFTDEEREKLQKSSKINLVSIKKININTGKVMKPVQNFMAEYTTQMYKAIGGSVNMTFVASRFRGTVRGLTFGEYLDLSLSNTMTDVDQVTKKLSVIYKALVNTSIGEFKDFDDFLQNFAFMDLPLGTYAVYIATNPEVLEMGLKCGVEECKQNFTVNFSARNLLDYESLSDYFKEAMEQAGTKSGPEAKEYHETSSVVTRQVIELPGTEVACEIGLRSCYEMIHNVLPFINGIETTMADKYPDDTNKVREIISYVTNYVSAIYLKDENGEYTIREDDLENMVDMIYNLPITAYGVIAAIMNQTDADYNVQFGIKEVTCPNCGNVTKFVTVNIDEEVFLRFQELGTLQINQETLPRL